MGQALQTLLITPLETVERGRPASSRRRIVGPTIRNVHGFLSNTRVFGRMCGWHENKCYGPL